MDNQLWSYILVIVGVVGFFFVGRKIWWSWYINLGCQILWFSYAIITEQWGFLLGAIFYTAVFSKNAYQWTRDHFRPQVKDTKKVFDKLRTESTTLREEAVKLASATVTLPYVINRSQFHESHTMLWVEEAKMDICIKCCLNDHQTGIHEVCVGVTTKWAGERHALIDPSHKKHMRWSEEENAYICTKCGYDEYADLIQRPCVNSLFTEQEASGIGS